MSAHDPGSKRGDEADEIFVGYLPVPPRLRRFALGTGAGALALIGALAASLALAMGTPGRGVIPFHGPERLVGIYQHQPHGILWTIEEGDAAPHAVLVIRGGKFGTPLEAARFDGQVVAIRGGIAERDGHQMIEINGLPEPSTELSDVSAARIRARATVELGEVTLRGEIVDVKCYLGRMRPGGGRAHRACAQLCIAGRVPPVLVSRDEHGAEHHYLLVDPEGSVIEDTLPYLAEPVEVRGMLERTGDLRVLRIDSASIRRL